jgi:hypothetical protein
VAVGMTSSDFGFDFSRAPGNSGDERKLLSLLRESEMAGKRRQVRARIFVAALSRNGWVSLWLAGDRGIRVPLSPPALLLSGTCKLGYLC